MSSIRSACLLTMTFYWGVKAWYEPGSKTSFIYDTVNSNLAVPTITTATGLKVTNDIYIIDLFDSTQDQIAKYKAGGKHVMCYFSAGSWEQGRPDSLDFDANCYCGPAGRKSDGTCNDDSHKMDGWPEYWLDLHSLSCVSSIENIMTKRIAMAKDKGCDGVDPDNTDSFSNADEANWGTTIEDERNYVLWLAETAHASDIAITLKNSGDLVSEYQTDIVNAFDGAVIEECHHYKECDTYKPFLDAGKAAMVIEYGKKITCAKDGFPTIVSSENTLDSSKIIQVCTGS